MGNLIFLVGALVLSVVGSVWLWLRNRPPTSVMSSIDGFRQEMSALAGERPLVTPPPAPRRARSGTVRPAGPAGSDNAVAGDPDTPSGRGR